MEMSVHNGKSERNGKEAIGDKDWICGDSE